MASANDTVVGFNLPGASNVATSISDASGNVWSITADGKVALNGVADQTTSFVIGLAYVNNEIFQENITDTWWGKNSPSDTWFGGWSYSPLPFGPSISPNQTIGNAIVDGNGNKWQIDAQGKVTVDGVVDQTTNLVINLAYVNGKVWQENINHDWWSKTLSTDAWAPSTNPGIISANNTVIYGTAGSIVDTNGNVWSINSNQQVVVNGNIDNTTGYVLELAYSGGKVYQQNVNNDWWTKGVPTDTWTPATQLYGFPFESGSSTVSVSAGSGGHLVDRANDVWTIVPSNNGQVAVNGFTDQTTSFVTQLVYSYGEIWQENINGDWWEKTIASDAWQQNTLFPKVDPSQALVMTPNQTLSTALSPDGENFVHHHPANGTIDGVGLSNHIIYEDTNDSISFTVTYTSNVNNTIIMGAGNEAVEEGALTNTVYGGSGIDTINALVGLNGPVGNSGLTFIGGSGTNAAFNVGIGSGGSGNTTMYGANNATLSAGTGVTSFGLMNMNDVVTINSFFHGVDKIISGGADVNAIVASETYTNGVAALKFGTSAAANVFVHTNTAIVASDFA